MRLAQKPRKVKKSVSNCPAALYELTFHHSVGLQVAVASSLSSRTIGGGIALTGYAIEARHLESSILNYHKITIYPR